MRALIIRADKYFFQDLAISNQPAGIQSLNLSLSYRTVRETILVLLCVEADDTAAKLNTLILRLNQLNQQYYHLETVAVVPFVHLSKRVAQPIIAYKLCQILVQKLKQTDLRVIEVTFGTHKKTELSLAGRLYDVSYFEC